MSMPPHAPAALEVDRLWASHGPAAERNAVLRGVDIALEPAACMVVVGGSGAGKSTLLKVLAGLHAPWYGTVRMDGQDLTDVPAYRRPSNALTQDPSLFPFLDSAGNVAFGPRRQHRRGWVAGQWRSSSSAALAADGLRSLARVRPGLLSGGQQQQVALCRAMVNQPSVLLLDEPFRGLDRQLRRALTRRLSAMISARRQSVVLATHDVEEVWHLADHVVVLEDGTVTQVDVPQQVYDAPATIGAMHLTGDAIPVDARCVHESSPAGLTERPGWLRPDVVTVHLGRAMPTPGSLVIPARILDLCVLPHAWLYHVRYTDGRDVRWRTTVPPQARRGDDVHLVAPVERLLRPAPETPSSRPWPSAPISGPLGGGDDGWFLDLDSSPSVS